MFWHVFSYSFLSSVLSVQPSPLHTSFFKLFVSSLKIMPTSPFIEITGIDFKVWWCVLSLLPGSLFSYHISRLEAAFQGFFMSLFHLTVFTAGEWGHIETLPSGTMILLVYALQPFPKLRRIMVAGIIFLRCNALFYLHIWRPRGLLVCVE